MNLRKSGEDYLEAIYVLKQQKGMVRSIDVAHHLSFSKPSVSRAVNILRAEGYLQMHPDGELELTDKGLDVATNIYERHTILTALFTSIGVPEKIALEDACRVEHAISEETFQRLKATHTDRLAGAGAPADEAGKAEEKDKGEKKKKKKKKNKE